MRRFADRHLPETSRSESPTLLDQTAVPSKIPKIHFSFNYTLIFLPKFSLCSARHLFFDIFLSLD